MFGDYDSKVGENKSLFERSGITPRSNGKALDLGCGSGFQTIALAELGFKVLGIDQCSALIDELRGRSAGRDIDVLQGNMLDYKLYADRGPFELAVCIGDTLTHLQGVEEISTLFKQVYDVLEEGGRLALSFRDLTAEIKGIERIIPGRNDEDKLMVIFLEYEEKYVNVHDIIFVKGDSGWELKKSAYKKFRIGMPRVQDLLQHRGFEISSSHVENGFSVIIAQK
jgi:SAM-dependent methyltransferase